MFNRGVTGFSRATGYLKGLSPDAARLYGPTFTQQKVNYSKFSKDSTIVCVGGPSMQSSILHAIQSSEIQDIKKFVIIGKRSWLLDVHPDWDDKPWGQCKRYLPYPMRQIVDELFRSYPDNVLLNFGMMKHVLLELERRLEETGVWILDEEVLEFKQRPEGLFGVMKHGEEFYFGDKKFRIVNAANIPGSYQDLPNNSTGLLYHSSMRDSTDPIALVGSGANLTWTYRDFSKIRQLIHLVPPNDRTRDELNNGLHYKIELGGDTTIQKLGNKIVVSGINSISGEHVMVNLPEDKVYSALGHKHNFGIVSSIDSKKIINVDCSASNKNIRFSQCVSSPNNSKVAYDFRGTVVPPGNMKYNFLFILSEIGLLDPSMPNAVIAYDKWQKALTEIAVVQEISIDEEFFNTLKPLVKHIYEVQVPTPEAVMKIIESHYKRANFPAQRKDGTKLTGNEFMDLLKGTAAREDAKDDLGEDPEQFKP